MALAGGIRGPPGTCSSFRIFTVCLVDSSDLANLTTVKIQKIRTPKKFAVITLKFEQGGFTVEYYIQRMQMALQTVKTLIRMRSKSYLGLHCLPRPI